MNEPLLFDGYRETYRVEPCACGGSVAAIHDNEHSIRLAVEEHNETDRHLTWRERCAGWMPVRPSGERPTVPQARTGHARAHGAGVPVAAVARPTVPQPDTSAPPLAGGVLPGGMASGPFRTKKAPAIIEVFSQPNTEGAR